MDEQDPIKALEAAQSALDRVQTAATSLPAAGQPWTAELIMFLTVSILLFACVAMGLATALLWRTKVSASQVLKVFGIVSIIGVSAVLLVTGYSNDQLTPIVGLFGAIAGYLLGRDGQPAVAAGPVAAPGGRSPAPAPAGQPGAPTGQPVAPAGDGAAPAVA
jgi:hypothetical protein